MSFSYANPTSGPGAGGIGWFDFGKITLHPGDSVTGLSGTLHDGSTVTFDLTLTQLSGLPNQFSATSVPTYPSAQFANTGYTGITGNVAMYTDQVYNNVGDSMFTIDNITVIDPLGEVVPNYSVLIADAESTNLYEGIQGETNGTPWSLFATVGNTNLPTLSGVGTQTFHIIGNQQYGSQDAYLLNSQSPSQILLTITQQDPFVTRQAFSIGFAVTKVTVRKNIGQRIDAADQFLLNISTNPTALATTTGSVNGIQAETAMIYAIQGNPYVISEAMAPGSTSQLNQYTVVNSAVNNTLAGTIPPVGVLPITFTPALGDDVIYTILNAAPQTFVKTVDKANADIGDVLTYTLTIENPNDITVNHVLMSDTTPIGTTYIGNLIVSAPYTGISPDTGLSITVIGPQDVVTISWQVQVTANPFVNQVLNVANITVPGGTSGNSNEVSTQIRHAVLSALKSVDKAYANVGDTLTYTMNLINSGNVAANKVVLTDPIPNNTTYVTGSVSSSVPFTGTPATGLILIAPIPVGGSATITYKVIVDTTVPKINPIQNTAIVTYAYTVDPAVFNGIVASTTSNTVNTLVSNATLTTKKTKDKVMSYVGDVITYQVAVTNGGNVLANDVILTDPVPNGTSYVAGSLVVNVSYTGSPLTTIHITNPIAPGETISLAYQVMVSTMPNPNPIPNTVDVAFTYTLDPLNPNSVNGTSASNTVHTEVFQNNYSQQISDLIHSIAREEAAIGNIANAEGAKIQRMIALGASANELLCVNKSVYDMLEALGILESILKQKLSTLDAQISLSCMK